MIKLKKRILALMLALSVLFCTVITYAEDPDDEDFGDEELTDEDIPFEEEEGKADFKTIAGYDTGEKYVCGDFTYQLMEDGQSAVVISYSGTSGAVISESPVPSAVSVMSAGSHHRSAMSKNSTLYDKVSAPIPLIVTS